MVKTCNDCGETLRGRSDKKFCSDQCRNNYNNRQNSESSTYVRHVNTILKKNRKIMEVLNPMGKCTMHRDKLTAKGYNFNFFTSTYTTRKGQTYYFCYEYGYLPIEHDLYALVKREDSVKPKGITFSEV
ncbi:MAG: hypothetical protein Q7J34_01125 [Bacteroidales bacterium]|jgi:DNA-directed RNA polymerase subunit M/transcription elongation factor TFIIS|nr:hypothetical protein [Bacteroidales bacterium]